MKKMKMLFFACFIILPSINVSAQTLSQLIDLHFDAVKQDKYNKLTTIITESDIVIGKQKGTLTVVHKRQNKMRKEMKIAGNTTVTAYDGIHAWKQINKEKPQLITGSEFDEVKFQADMDGYFFCWREKDHKLTLLGEDKLSRKDVFKIKCEKENGDNADLYLDSKSYLLVRTVQRMNRAGKTVTTETDISGYKKIDGIPFPRKYEIKSGDSVEIRNVRDIILNKEVPDSVFTLPGQIEK